MSWKEIILSIQKQLLSRNLSNPKIRLNALESIENLIDKKYIENPNLLLEIGKEKLKADLSKKKNLNSAEKSIVNHLYDVINGKPIPRRTPIIK
jgi:hypothetical protein